MKTFSNFFTALILVFISYSCGYGQDVDVIIKKHIKAHGGIENWDKVNVLKITGNYTSFSETKAFTTFKSKPGKYYRDYYLGKFNVKEAFDGKDGWTINPWFDISYARRTNAIENNVLKQKSEFCTPFFNYKEKAYTVEFKGKENLEGKDVLKLVLTKSEDQVETWYLDAKTYLEYISTSTWEDFGYPNTQETFYSEFTKVGKLIIPFYTETTFPTRLRITEIENVEINPEIDSYIFNMPLSDEMEQLSVLAGEWDVTINVLNRRGEWMTADNTVSKIKFRNNMNMLEEEISYVNYFPVHKLNCITYNSVTKKYRLTVFNDFYSNLNIFEGLYQGDSIVFDNKSINFILNDENKRYRTFTFKAINKDSFTIELSVSNDKGETWTARQRFIYSRKKA